MTNTVGDTALLFRQGHFIGGEWVPANRKGEIPVENPSTADVIGSIAAGDATDVATAVDAATEAMAKSRRHKWAAASRGEALWALADAVAARAEQFAQLEMLDGGKPISNAQRVDVPGTVAALRYFAGWATKLTGETVEMSVPGNWHGYTKREPVGVVGQINPWNYPLMGAAFKIGPAIAAGCATVLKPAEQTSLSTLWLAELSRECGFPPGYFNVVTGTGQDVGAALVAHPGIAKIAFTGSTQTGREVAAAGARQMKRVTVELGGKSPIVVLPDADLDQAAKAIALGIFFNTGQTCSAGSRLFMHSSIANELVSKIASIAGAMRIGPGHDPSTQIGPVISAVQRGRVMSFVEGAAAQGARLVRSGKLPDGSGYFVEPFVLCEVTPDMPAVREEIFGPVLCAIPFETLDLDEIADLANDTEYGLAAYVWTRDLSKAFGLVDRLRAGTVRINAGGGGDMSLPAGGTKQSGFGRENGRAGVEAYTELKSVTVAY